MRSIMPILNHKHRDCDPESWQDIRAHIRDQHE